MRREVVVWIHIAGRLPIKDWSQLSSMALPTCLEGGPWKRTARCTFKKEGWSQLQSCLHRGSDFGAPKIKPVTFSTVSPSICQEVMESDAMILVFWMLNFMPTISLSVSFFFFKLNLDFLKSLFYNGNVQKTINIVTLKVQRIYLFIKKIFFAHPIWLLES